MDIKIVISLLMLIFSGFCVNAQTKTKDSLVLKERANLKKYAFCKCLIGKYPADSTLKTDGSLMGYIETGSYGNRAYEIVDSFVAKQSAIRYNSKQHNNLYLMRCIDIYDSRELDSLIKRLDIYLNR